MRMIIWKEYVSTWTSGLSKVWIVPSHAGLYIRHSSSCSLLLHFDQWCCLFIHFIHFDGCWGLGALGCTSPRRNTGETVQDEVDAFFAVKDEQENVLERAKISASYLVWRDSGNLINLFTWYVNTQQALYSLSVLTPAKPRAYSVAFEPCQWWRAAIVAAFSPLDPLFTEPCFSALPGTMYQVSVDPLFTERVHR